MMNRCFVGISESSLLELMSQAQVLKSLCLRWTDLVDQALYNFVGSSLEMLDVSDTKVCCQVCGNWHVLSLITLNNKRFMRLSLK